MEDAILNILRRYAPDSVSGQILRQELSIPERSTYKQEKELYDALENLRDINLIRKTEIVTGVRYILSK